MINSFIYKNNKSISCNVTTNNGANNLGVMLQIVQLKETTLANLAILDYIGILVIK